MSALKSMTGYARTSASSDAYEAVVEIRSVNHRYLEVRLRLQGGAGLGALEKKLRDRVAEALSRGKVDVNLHVKPKKESAYEIEVDGPLLEELVRRARSAALECSVPGELSVSDLIGFQPAFQVRERKLSDEGGIEEVLDRALADGLAALDAMRAAEGKELASDFERRLKTLVSGIDEVERLSEGSRESKRAELLSKVEEILAASLEPSAIASEVARLVERADVAEEITRFRSHVELWRSAVSGSEPCGKKLDFIVQEMNREVNTIGSKCQDARITATVIALKSELERIREQVQNVE